MPRETFISHASPDRAFVERLVAMLGRHGVPFWYSDTNIQGGQQWHDEIGAALRRCDWVVVCLRPPCVLGGSRANSCTPSVRNALTAHRPRSAPRLRVR